MKSLGWRAFWEGLGMASSALRGQMLRAILTALIISIGIMALVGMLTATTAMESAITGQFSQMGATSFTFQSGGMSIRIGKKGRTEKQFPGIPLRQALRFQQNFHYQGAIVSVSDVLSGTAQLQLGTLKTNPNVQLIAADNEYFKTTGYSLKEGRLFSQQELFEGRNVVILGQDVALKLFPEGYEPGKSIRLQRKSYRVVGVLSAKGNSSFMSQDQAVVVPLKNGHRTFGTPFSSYAITTKAVSLEWLDPTLSEARATFRAVRNLPPSAEDNFNVRRSDSISSMLIEQLSSVGLVAGLIGAITLLGASISLMNIMLVSVTERTREIGVRKALGATRNTITLQFLLEAVLVSIAGGVFGIVLGVLIGNVLSSAMGGTFIVPWNWIGMAVLLCIVVGIVAGLYPARKAAALDPIESLRYE